MTMPVLKNAETSPHGLVLKSPSPLITYCSRKLKSFVLNYPAGLRLKQESGIKSRLDSIQIDINSIAVIIVIIGDGNV
jgi:hypothetical protein